MAIDFASKVLGPAYEVFGAAATYAPPSGGPAAPITLIRPDDGDPAADTDGVRVIAERIIRHVRKSELASPEEGATIAEAGTSYTVATYWEVGEGLEWALDLNPA